MFDEDSQSEISPKEQQLRMFKNTALGKMFSRSYLTDSNEIVKLLKQKRQQANEIDIQALSMRSQMPHQIPEASQIDRQRTYRMPTIRKSPFRQLESPIKPQDFEEAPSVHEVINHYDEIPDESDVYWSKIDSIGWRPETRQEATLTSIGAKLYLIGGVSRSINSDINVYNTVNKRWEKLYPGGCEPDPRFGHNALEYNGAIVVFGGGTNFNTVHKLRECLNGVKVYSPQKNDWTYIKTQGTYIATRKYHCASIAGKHMFIHGGLNQKNNLLADAAVLNLVNNNWKTIEIKGNGPKENAFHTAATILNSDQFGSYSIYSIPISIQSKIKMPGIYVFGGIGPDKKAHSNLWVLNVGARPLFWSTPSTQGIPPSPRFLHSMVYNDRLNSLVIFGGRIDVANTTSYTCFNDVYLLKLDNLLWIRVNVLGSIPTPRSGHCMASSGSRIYIFGGVSNTCYCSSDIYMLEIHPKIVKHLYDDEEKKRVHEKNVEIFRANRVLGKTHEEGWMQKHRSQSSDVVRRNHMLHKNDANQVFKKAGTAILNESLL
ncbi:unnamed protein product [Blepharisma stoltei]|uniref:Kelch repeat-containing protein n=1 Tax=Blepharisma stoltei TaxID=1481888 RepID=A0AAU9IU07_9CILI|nr:unnamed protein product [Blepharisma stoltei]